MTPDEITAAYDEAIQRMQEFGHVVQQYMNRDRDRLSPAERHAYDVGMAHGDTHIELIRDIRYNRRFT